MTVHENYFLIKYFIWQLKSIKQKIVIAFLNYFESEKKYLDDDSDSILSRWFGGQHHGLDHRNFCFWLLYHISVYSIFIQFFWESLILHSLFVMDWYLILVLRNDLGILRCLVQLITFKINKQHFTFTTLFKT